MNAAFVSTKVFHTFSGRVINNIAVNIFITFLRILKEIQKDLERMHFTFHNCFYR